MNNDPLNVTVKSNAKQIAALMGGAAKREIPYATARALTDLAFEGMRHAKAELDRSLELRNRFSQAGIQVNRAEKSDWPKTQAQVGIEERRSYLIDHILGRTRKPKSSPFQAIPNIGPVKRTKSGKVRGRQRPKAMLERVENTGRRSPYAYRISKQGSAEALLRWEKGRRDPVLVYWFEKSVQIEPEFDMVDAVQDIVSSEYERTFIKRLEQAVASSKRKTSS